MTSAPHSVGETDAYLRRCATVGVSAEDREGIVDQVGRAPADGAVIRNSGGMRKVRYGGRGGYRVLVLYLDAESPVYLMSILAKSQAANFSEAQVKILKNLAMGIKAKLKAGKKRS